MKDEQGKITADSEGMKEIWRKYMEKLLNVENNWDGQVECDKVIGPKCHVDAKEVSKAMSKMKCGKAAGPSGVEPENVSS